MTPAVRDEIEETCFKTVKLEAAFVEYGAARHGFLPLKEISRDYYQAGVDPNKAGLKELLRERGVGDFPPILPAASWDPSGPPSPRTPAALCAATLCGTPRA